MSRTSQGVESQERNEGVRTAQRLSLVVALIAQCVCYSNDDPLLNLQLLTGSLEGAVLPG
jgi:hypothetical protein